MSSDKFCLFETKTVFLSVSYLLFTFCSLCLFCSKFRVCFSSEKITIFLPLNRTVQSASFQIIYITHTRLLIHKSVNFISFLFPWLGCKAMGMLLWEAIKGDICSANYQNIDIMSSSHFCIKHTASYCCNNKQKVCNFLVKCTLHIKIVKNINYISYTNWFLYIDSATV